VTTAAGAEGTARTSLHAPSGHTVVGSRASLVDAVMDLPEVQASNRLEASVPLGDGEALDRLRERTADAVTRPAGSTRCSTPTCPRTAGPRTTNRKRVTERRGGRQDRHLRLEL